MNRTLLLIFTLLTLISSSTSYAAKKVRKNTVATQLTPAEQQRFDYFFQGAMTEMAADRTASAMELLRHCLHINPNAAEAYFFLADGYDVEGQDNDSIRIALLSKAIDLAPDNDTYKESLIPLYLNSHNVVAAASLMEDIVQRTPERTDMLQVLLQIYNYESNYPKALSTLDRLELQEGKNEETTMSKVQILTTMGRDDDAYNELRKLCEANPLNYDCQVMLGNWLMGKGRKDEAIKVYRGILREEPEHEGAMLSLYDYYDSEGMTELKNQQLDRILTSNTVSDKVRAGMLSIYIGDAINNKVDSTTVLDKFRMVERVRPDDVELLKFKAQYMNTIKMPQPAIDALMNTILEKKPDDMPTRLYLVSQAWERQDSKQMISICKPAVEYNPEVWTMSYYLAVGYFLDDDFTSCISTIERVRSLIDPAEDKNIALSMYEVLGDAYHSVGQMDKAFAAYEDCLEIDPDHVTCLNNYAYFLSETGKDLDKAAAMSFKTIQAEPSNSTYLDTYAWIVYLQGNYSDAEIYIDMALKYLPKDTDPSVYNEHARAIKEKLK